MALPKPKKDEKKQKFVSRCIEELASEEKGRFPTSGQRAAVCYSKWGETPAEKERAAAQKAAKQEDKPASKEK